ncbi:MAG: hypothetical protein AAGN35_24740, partial [Bacteroidota bacterium]
MLAQIFLSLKAHFGVHSPSYGRENSGRGAEKDATQNRRIKFKQPLRGCLKLVCEICYRRFFCLSKLILESIAKAMGEKIAEE